MRKKMIWKKIAAMAMTAIMAVSLQPVDQTQEAVQVLTAETKLWM